MAVNPSLLASLRERTAREPCRSTLPPLQVSLGSLSVLLLARRPPPLTPRPPPPSTLSPHGHRLGRRRPP